MTNKKGNMIMRNVDLKNKHGLNEKEFLDSYIPGDYARPSNTVDMLLFTVDDVPLVGKDPDKALKLLLIKRGDHPYLGCYAIPGGFVHIDEALSTACYRELKEETNIDSVYFEQLKTFGDLVERDPRMRVISIAYIALVDKTNIKPKAGDDATYAQWFTLRKDFITSNNSSVGRVDTYNLTLVSDDGEIKIGYLVTERFVKNGIISSKVPSYELLDWSKEELAFDHIDLIYSAIERLKNKIEYTPIAFTLLPKYFTLREIQKLYEAILNVEKPFSRANFRRKIAKMVIKTDKEKLTSGRPATCYMFNEGWEHSFFDE
jgi:8-oxo-dGTP diphosphatase